MGTMRSLVTMASALLCACSSESLDGSNIDLTAYVAELESLCTGVFEGAIQDGGGSNASVTYETCAYDSTGYQIDVEFATEMYCNSSEDDEGVDCSHAQTGTILLEGTLWLDTGLEVDVTGSAGVQKVHFKDAPDLWCAIWPAFENDVPHQSFRTIPEFVEPGGSGLESFIWERRHSEEDAAEMVWEVCVFNIDSHE